jgi:hypothetical protein
MESHLSQVQASLRLMISSSRVHATKLEMGRLHGFDLIEQSATKMEMVRLHECDTPSHCKGIGTTPGKPLKKISRLPALDDDRFADDVGITPVSFQASLLDSAFTSRLRPTTVMSSSSSASMTRIVSMSKLSLLASARGSHLWMAISSSTMIMELRLSRFQAMPLLPIRFPASLLMDSALVSCLRLMTSSSEMPYMTTASAQLLASSSRRSLGSQLWLRIASPIMLESRPSRFQASLLMDSSPVFLPRLSALFIRVQVSGQLLGSS